LALGTLQRGLRRRRMEVDGQSEGKRLVEVNSITMSSSIFASRSHLRLSAT
jgi:hypothetical protein